MEFLVVPKITGLTPTNKLDISGIKIPEYIKLSDENFYSPGRINLLLSNQIFFEILNNGKIKLAAGKLILQDTVFGYVASGVMSHNYNDKSYFGLVTNANELNNSIKRFCEIENCPDFEIPTMSREANLFTYGTQSAPYLTTRSLKQLAIDDGDKYPLAAEVIMSDVYMDDLTGEDDLESGRKLQVQLVSMLKGAGMELHKWSASNPLLLPDSMCQVKDLSYSSPTETKTLRLLWKPHPDSFAFKISHDLKRAKILLQSLWQLKLDWNDPLPSNLVSNWKSFIDALESINCLDIPRYCLQDKSIRTELHGFSDSFEKAYVAALYLRCINTSGQISVRLLCSKSKVAPLQSITIPDWNFVVQCFYQSFLKEPSMPLKLISVKNLPLD
ncbi:uncharacterized protein TNCV_1086451 [Trichonephila clavipes]|nr:uncharacterized protein TNCV_1086451 [Trichonephila clavipes]